MYLDEASDCELNSEAEDHINVGGSYEPKGTQIYECTFQLGRPDSLCDGRVWTTSVQLLSWHTASCHDAFN